MELFKILGTIAIDGAEKAEKALDKVTGTAKNVQSTFAPVTKAIGGAAVALGGAGVAAVKMASDYDTAFAQVNTLLTGSEADIQKYKNDIISASNETGKSTTEMSGAIYNAISAGVEQGEAIKFTTEAMKLAKGGFTDATTAVDILTTAINAYGLESGDATKIANKLITTQNLGKTTVDELASSMGKVIPTAKSLGVDIDDLCGMYATMTSNGIATAETTTYMNSMLNELGKQGTTASKAFAAGTEHIKEGGLTMKEAMDSGWELTDVLSILDEQAAESGTSINNMFASAEAGKAANVLWDNAQKLNDAVDAMGNSAGATEEAYKKMDETLSSKMEKMKTRFQNVGIEVGQKLFPIVEKGMTWVEEHMPEIQENIDKLVPVISNLIQIVIEKGVPALTKVLEYVGKAVEWFTNLNSTQQSMIGVIVAVLAAISPVAGVIASVTSAISTLMPILEAVGAAIAGISAPVLAVVAVIGVLVGAFVTLWNTNEEFRNNILGIWEEIKSTFSAFMQGIVDELNSLGFDFENISDVIKTVWNGLCSFLAPIFEGAFNSIKIAFKLVTDVILGNLKIFVGIFKGDWSKVLEGIKQIISAWKTYITDIFKNAFNVINKLTGGKLGEMVDKFKEKLEAIKQSVHDAVEKIKSMIKLPHFTISGEFSLNPPSVPSFGIDWYAKAMNDPIIMNSPTAFGLNKNGQVMAGGEAGSEVVSGTDTLMNMISEAVAAKNERLEEILQNILSYMPQMASMQLVMDTGATVGALAPAMDRELGKRATRSGRGV